MRLSIPKLMVTKINKISRKRNFSGFQLTQGRVIIHFIDFISSFALPNNQSYTWLLFVVYHSSFVSCICDKQLIDRVIWLTEVNMCIFANAQLITPFRLINF